MIPRIRLVLLGDAIAYDGDEAIRCSSKKAFALFAFLALQRRAHSRKSLAALFWGRRDAEAARASLRATLFRLPPPLAACVAIERETLGLGQPVALSCDVGAFEALARADDVAQLRQAAALYRGHLLQDFDAEATPEFDDWLDGERVRLKQSAYDCFDRLIAMHFATDASTSTRAAARPASDEAIALAQRWLAMDPAAERAHRWLIRSYVDSGRNDAAQAQYELCQRALAVAEGRAPAPETHALLAASGARSDAPGASTSTRSRADGLAPASVASTSFVGRVEEIAELARLFGDAACRLITLHGLGGVGKTRLAHAVASQLASRFANGATWISLEAVERPEALADTMARALGLDVGPRVAARSAIVEALRAQERLIVVDNFEQLLAAPVDDPANDPVDVLLTLLREAPRVRVIVTSRQTLGVQEEWVYVLEGLAHVASAGEVSSPGAASPPAVELFVQRARQAYLGFSPAAEMPHVLRICAHVDGLPLGLELAAAWVRTVPCAEIAQELERGLDLPPGEQRNRPERQRSLRAVIDFSWRLLSTEQQDVLAALSEFRGGFTRDAAEHVAKASLRALSALVDKALVRRSSDSRFSLHPLVRAFAAEKLAMSRGRRALARARHSSYYLRLLCSQRVALYGAQHRPAQTRLVDDLDNIRAAWEAAVDDGDANAVREAARPLCVILDRLGLYDEWTRTFDHALDSFPGDATAEARSAALRLLVAAANGHWRRGDATRAKAHRERLLAALGQAHDESERAEVHKLCGLIEREAGNFDGALSHFRAGALAAQAAGDTINQGQLENEVGVLYFRRGDLVHARASFMASFRMNEAVGNAFDRPMSLHNVAYCDLELGSYDAADAGFREALAAFRGRADARGEAMALSSLGILARRRGDLDSALEHARESLAVAQRTANRGAVADATDDLARVLDKLGLRDEAKSLYARALAMARELGQVHLQCFVLLHLARAEAGDGDATASARSLDEALRLACEHDFQAGRLMGLLGAAQLRLAQGDAAARDVGAAWCRAALAEAGSNMDVRDAVPDVAADLLDVARHPVPERALDLALAEAVAFLATLAAGEYRAQAPP